MAVIKTDNNGIPTTVATAGTSLTVSNTAGTNTYTLTQIVDALESAGLLGGGQIASAKFVDLPLNAEIPYGISLDLPKSSSDTVEQPRLEVVKESGTGLNKKFRDTLTGEILDRHQVAENIHLYPDYTVVVRQKDGEMFIRSKPTINENLG